MVWQPRPLMTALSLLVVFPATISAFVRPLQDSRSFLSMARSSVAVSDETTDRTTAVVWDPSFLAALKKPSKTLSVGLELVETMKLDDVSLRSMQLRNLGVNLLATSDTNVAQALVKEQATAKGSFPEPCPVLFLQLDDESTAVSGTTAAAACIRKVRAHDVSLLAEERTIWLVQDKDDVQKVMDAGQPAAFAVDVSSNNENTAELLSHIPENALCVVALVDSMQADNTEISIVKELNANAPATKFTTVVLKHAIAGDAEDLEYAKFSVQGLTKKRSSTFNMSGM